ncbi:cerebellin 11 [Denticeps clupeoides]|uniref:cerebellin 11 n=1 Tax=Denticeps clupeoides TaxID=299321 RepID=UPI0010A38BB4|nr:complement C1q-like protein 4 [Denticeps clupeoides]
MDILGELKDLRAAVEKLTLRLDATERALEREQAEKQRVAFTASILTSKDQHHGPFNDESNLVFSKILTNIGNAYNPNTGVFTAPVKGVYYFRYSGYGYAGNDMGLSIFKGSQRMVSSYEHRSADSNDNVSNGVVLELDVGDVVYARLWINTWVFTDSRYDYCTFSGFLLYPL